MEVIKKLIHKTYCANGIVVTLRSHVVKIDYKISETMLHKTTKCPNENAYLKEVEAD